MEADFILESSAPGSRSAAKRPRVAAACQLCKKRRRRCSGQAPCELCTKNRVQCTFEPLVSPGQINAEKRDKEKIAAYAAMLESSAPGTSGHTNSYIDDLPLVQMYYKCMEEDLPLLTSNSFSAALSSAAGDKTTTSATMASDDTHALPSSAAGGAGVTGSKVKIHPEEAIMLRIFRGNVDVPFLSKRIRTIDNNLEEYAGKLLFHTMAAAGAMFMLKVEPFDRHYNAAIDMIGACFARPCSSVVSSLGILAMLTPVVSRQTVQAHFMLQLAESMIDSGMVVVNPELRFAIRLLGQVWIPSEPADEKPLTSQFSAHESSTNSDVSRVGWAASRLTRGFFRGYDNLAGPVAVQAELTLLEGMRRVASSSSSPAVTFLRSMPLDAYEGQLLLALNKYEDALERFRLCVELQEKASPEKRWCAVLLRIHDTCRKLQKTLVAECGDDAVRLDDIAAKVAQGAASLVVWNKCPTEVDAKDSSAYDESEKGGVGSTGASPYFKEGDNYTFPQSTDRSELLTPLHFFPMDAPLASLLPAFGNSSVSDFASLFFPEPHMPHAEPLDEPMHAPQVKRPRTGSEHIASHFERLNTSNG